MGGDQGSFNCRFTFTLEQILYFQLVVHLLLLLFKKCRDYRESDDGLKQKSQASATPGPKVVFEIENALYWTPGVNCPDVPVAPI
ncbi:hypothetical protein GCM10027098_19630 [Bowmanella dokdonensis]